MAELKTVPIVNIMIPDVRVSSILNEEQAALLQSTVKEVGVIQDPVVRALGDGAYQLISGRSRISSLLALGITEVQVKVIEADEKLGLIMNIVENVARGSYDYISISRAIRKLKAMGTTAVALEKIFPWKKRWIKFIEELQDLPDDITEAIASRRITPTHVQTALDLPTPYEVHAGLKTAINLEWDTGTFKTFVRNRVEQIQRARQAASEQGLEPVIPPAVPAELIQYKQCLLCGYKKPADQVTIYHACDGCRDLVWYLTSQLGPSEEAMNTVYSALQAYYGKPPAAVSPGTNATPGSVQE